jgi:hypothetical protein
MLSNDLAWTLDEDGRVRCVNARTGAVITTCEMPAVPTAASGGGGHLVVRAEGGRAFILVGSDLELRGEFQPACMSTSHVMEHER